MLKIAHIIHPVFVDPSSDLVTAQPITFETMTTDLQTTLRNRTLVPSDRVLVSQSGMFTRDDVLPIERAGVDAIQVGTSLMQDDDMKGQIQRLLGRDS